MNNKRLLGVELLRIIAMYYVLVAHYTMPIHGGVTLDSFLSDPFVTLLRSFFGTLGSPCVDIFIIISGFFGIRWKWKGLFNLLFMIYFWMIIITPLCHAIGVSESFNLAQYAEGVLFSFRANWFFLAYLVLYALSPILNSFLANKPEKKILQVVAAFFFVQTLFGYIMKCSVEFQNGMTSMSFIGLYLLGGYLNRSTHPWVHLSQKGNVLVVLACIALLITLGIGGKVAGIQKEVSSYINPITIVQGAYTFLLFYRMNIKKCARTIMFFSSSAFAVLLAHTREGGELYHSIHVWIHENVQYDVPVALLYMALFFTVAVCIDKVRKFFWQIISR